MGNAQNWSNEIATLKSWISGRIEWINSQLKSYNSCANVQTPKLAISKINYHPMSLIDDATDDTLEFIAITNNSSQIVNLTGIYFRELGLVYQFPDNATIQPNQEIYLASNADKFKSWYGIDAFDQYFRFLSNKSQRLWLADAYGNTIDDVTYYDESPWPVQADGQGYYLQRNDLNVSGASASNWIASNQVLTGTIDIVVSPDLILYPSPATDFVRIANSNTEFISYEIFDITGQLVGNADLGVDKSISLRGLSPNIYLVKLHSIDGQVLVKRVIKR